MEYVTVIKSGRAFNGAHRDAGTIIHLVKPMPPNTGGFWGDKALCGTEPGRRGNGWDQVKKEVTEATCVKCVKKWNKDNPWPWTCEHCGERFINENEFETHQWNNKHCPSIRG